LIRVLLGAHSGFVHESAHGKMRQQQAVVLLR
jgi:hypothetical protein